MYNEFVKDKYLIKKFDQSEQLLKWYRLYYKKEPPKVPGILLVLNLHYSLYVKLLRERKDKVPAATMKNYIAARKFKVSDMSLSLQQVVASTIAARKLNRDDES